MSDPLSPAADTARDRAEIASLVEEFFAAFVSGPDSDARLEGLRSLFLPGAVVVATCGGEPAVCDVDGFIAPRAELLRGGSLTGFREWREDGRIDLFGDIAHWFGAYAKSAVRDGVPWSGRGMKSLQLVRTAGGWRISAAAWDDERA